MSRRRRREGEEDGDVLSEAGSSDGQEEKLSHVSESDDDLDVSEYESVEEEARHSSDEGEKEINDPASKEVKQVEEAPESEQELEATKNIPTKTERESGDGKEQSDSEPHKDDGDEKKQKEEDDPAFIPRKGAFFQHDVRSEDQPKGRGRERRLWDKDPQWKHDMFVMEEQMPKSRDILISRYGYDIRTRSLDAPPPPDARRSRGRGRGGYRGRGRGGRPQGDQQRADHSNKNGSYKDEYPAFNEEFPTVKHRTRSYYNRNTKRELPTTRDPPEDSPMKINEEREYPALRKSNARTEEQSRSSPKPKSSVEKKDEKFSDILQVINNRDNKPSSKEMSSMDLPSSRVKDRHPENRQNTYTNYQEAPKPRRYSSLRQRQTNSPVDKQSSQQHEPRSRERMRYSNFSKPVQPNPTASRNFQKNYAAGDTQRLLPNQAIAEDPIPAPLPTQTQPVTHQPQPPVSLQQAPLSVQQPVGFPDSSQTHMGALPGPGMMPQMPIPYNTVLNPVYFEAASHYQRMLRAMSQMNMSVDQLQQMQSAMPPPMDPISAIPPDPQSLPHPTSEMQMNPLLLPASQALSPGTLGSVMRPPHQAMNPPTYFSSPMGVNMAAPQQQPFTTYPTNLVAQQVGGVTYFNAPTQSPPTIPPGPNQASPRRNAAVPIMAPNMFGGPAAVE